MDREQLHLKHCWLLYLIVSDRAYGLWAVTRSWPIQVTGGWAQHKIKSARTLSKIKSNGSDLFDQNKWIGSYTTLPFLSIHGVAAYIFMAPGGSGFGYNDEEE